MSVQHIEATNPLVIPGAPDVTYPYVFVEDLQSSTIFRVKTSATAFFRFYRIDENNERFEVPLALGRPVLVIDDVDEALSILDGPTIIDILMNGGGLKEVIEYACVTIAKARGII